MPRQNVAQTNFTSGEVSPILRGRVDSNRYASGAESISNFIVRPQGAAWRRSGTRYVSKTRSSGDGLARLIPFEYSDTAGYVLEFTEGMFRIYKDGNPVLDKTGIYGLFSSQASNGGLTQITINLGHITVNGIIDNGFTKVRVVCDAAHRLLTGDIVHLFTPSGGPFTIPDSGAVVTYVDSVTFDLNTVDFIAVGDAVFVVPGRKYIKHGTYTNLNGATTTTFTTNTLSNHGLKVGDKLTTYGKKNPGSAFSNGASMTVSALSSDPTYFAAVIDTHYFDLFTTNQGLFFEKWINAGDTVEIANTASSITGIQRVHSVESESAFTIANAVYPSTFLTGAVYYSIVEVPTVYGEDELQDIYYTQSADVMYLAHPSYPTKKILRFTNDSWLFYDCDFKDGPYLPLNSNAPTRNPYSPELGTLFPDVYLITTNYAHTATMYVTSLPCSLSDNGGFYKVTSNDHGLIAGNVITIAETGTTADGSRTVGTVIDDDNFGIGLAFGSTGSGTYTVPFVNADDSKYIEYRESDQFALARCPVVAGGESSVTVTIIENVMSFIDAATRIVHPEVPQPVQPTYVKDTSQYHNAGSQKRAPSADAITENAGVLRSNFTGTFGRSELGKYVRYHTVASPPVAQWGQISTVSANGQTATRPFILTMTANNSVGNFVVANHSRTGTVKSYRNGAVYGIFASTDVGRIIRLGFGGRWVWGTIATYVSSSEVTVSFEDDFPRNPSNGAKLAGSPNGSISSSGSAGTLVINGSTSGRTYDWRLGSFSATTGYPAIAGFHEQRLCFARTATQPQTVFTSVSGDYENFTPTEFDSTVLDDSAIQYTLVSDKINPIRWISSGPSLIIGTSGGEWLARAADSISQPMTPSNITVSQHTAGGSSSAVRPIRVGASVIFADRAAQRIRDTSYSFSDDSLISRDLTLVSEHILRDGDGAVASMLQQEPNNLVWYVLDDGTLACLTYNKEQEVAAWHRHSIANAEVESVAVVPHSTGDYDVLYMVCKRTVNGATVRFVEYMEKDFYPSNSTDLSSLRFLDCMSVFTSPGATVTGLTHLEGQTVAVMGDGVYRGTFTVASGAITLAGSYTTVVIGYNYTSALRSLPPEGASPFGAALGQTKKIAQLSVRVLDSLDFKYGWLNSIQTSQLDTQLGVTQFKTETVQIRPNNPHDLESQWEIRQSLPYPLVILAVNTTLEGYE